MIFLIFQKMEEQKFLNVLKQVVESPVRQERTCTGTHSLFGVDLQFSLEKSFPLLTTRQISLRMVFEELMWFLRGQTDNTILQEKGIHIWDGNSSREFLDKRGLYYLDDGDIGAAYGFQFRHFGAPYINCHTKHVGGVDQVAQVIHLLKTDPTSRRIIISLWNPTQLDEMSLPACLWSYQFYVESENGTNYLSCKLTQRSSDIALAGGWNICTGSLLVYMLAHVCGMIPRRLVWSVGDAHVYLNQVDGVHEQLSREPRSPPTLEIVKTPVGDTELQKLLTFEWDCFKLNDYNPHKRIKLAMNV
jgi:thymidylate synthase